MRKRKYGLVTGSPKDVLYNIRLISGFSHKHKMTKEALVTNMKAIHKYCVIVLGDEGEIE